MARLLALFAATSALSLAFAANVSAQSEQPAASTAFDAALSWPEVTQTARPWTRWWWLGSAVDDANLTRLLETYHAAGLGGVEITSIYGARGAEDRYLPYLSDKWRDAVRHTLHEANRLGMGVDLPTGSGWRTGGPSVSDDDANMAVMIEKQQLESDRAFTKSFSRPLPQAVVAYGGDGQIIEVTNQIDSDGKIDWQPPAGKWTVYTVSSRWSRDNVKRPAPGGEGKNINPLLRRALINYLDYFGKHIDDLPAAGIRAQFHDSYEYEGNWCDDFFAQFEKRRGYRLQDHLPELTGEGTGDEVARIKHDYRETVSDLILEEFITPWTAWSHQHGMKSRNQSHGSPANWLDLYAAVDIPETESFGRLVGGDGHPLVFKFASSAAHVAGKPLVSAETATWLDEHFHETLGQMKEMVDRLFLAGVNHVIYHGTAYSPADAAWPGWLFYASTQVNPQNPIWRDLPALNDYITRCQSIFQSTKPDNDILLYWPIHDSWQNFRGLRMDLRVHNARDWLFDTQFGHVAQWLDEHGYAFDYISDRQLANCRVDNDLITTPGGSKYRVVLVPEAKYLPLATLQKLVELADAGAIILFANSLPKAPPGLASEDLRADWENAISQLKADVARQTADPTSFESWLQESRIGQGFALVSSDLQALPDGAGVPSEEWRTPKGLNFIRRAWDGGHVYFIKNESDQPFDDWIAPAVEFQSAAIMNPLDGRIGLAELRDAAGQGREVRLQLTAGQSVFLKTSRKSLDGQRWMYDKFAGIPTPIVGQWSVEFLTGGPELPPRAIVDKLESWTKFAAPEGERFAGTARYTTKFDAPAGPGRYRLNLGKVADSAEITINGSPVATLFTAPYQIDADLAAHNQLTIDVTNVAANRIRDMDRRKIEWRIFHDINLVSIQYGRFDAANWPIRDAGLLGPVTLQQLESQSTDNSHGE